MIVIACMVGIWIHSENTICTPQLETDLTTFVNFKKTQVIISLASTKTRKMSMAQPTHLSFNAICHTLKFLISMYIRPAKWWRFGCFGLRLLAMTKWSNASLHFPSNLRRCPMLIFVLMWSGWMAKAFR